MTVKPVIVAVEIGYSRYTYGVKLKVLAMLLKNLLSFFIWKADHKLAKLIDLVKTVETE